MAIDRSTEKLLDEAHSYAHARAHQLSMFVSDGKEEESWLSGCLQCGMRAIARPAGGIKLEGASLVDQCDGENKARVLETRAWIFGERHSELQNWLGTAIEKLGADLRDFFYPGEFQPERKRWISDDGRFSIQWKLRANPDEPISSSNPQSESGVVEIITIVSDVELVAAVYTGPTLDLNDEAAGDDEWYLEPLVSGEAGYAYHDDQVRLRFRRDDGTLGFFVEERYLDYAVVEGAITEPANTPASSAQPSTSAPVAEAAPEEGTQQKTPARSKREKRPDTPTVKPFFREKQGQSKTRKTATKRTV